MATEANIMASRPNTPGTEHPTLKLVAADWEDDKLVITLEGPDIQTVTSAEARKIAYNARVRYGMSSAGLEEYGGPYPYDPEEKKELETAKQMSEARNKKGLVYRNRFRLTSPAV